MFLGITYDYPDLDFHCDAEDRMRGQVSGEEGSNPHLVMETHWN